MSLDDILGQQQDDIARLRYGMVRAIEDSQDFQGCRTTMDIHRRYFELNGETALRESLRDVASHQFPKMANPSEWVDQAVEAVRVQDEGKLDTLYRQAALHSLFHG